MGAQMSKGHGYYGECLATSSNYESLINYATGSMENFIPLIMYHIKTEHRTMSHQKSRHRTHFTSDLFSQETHVIRSRNQQLVVRCVNE